MLEGLLLGRRGTARQSHREWAEERNRLQVYEETGGRTAEGEPRGSKLPLDGW